MVVAAHDLLEISSVSGSTITTGWVKPVSGSLYTFTAMVDTPDTYVGQADKLVAVNAGESDLEFIIRTPSSTVVSETSYGQAANAGSVTSSFSRGDHTHGTPAAPPVPTFITLTDAPSSYSGKKNMVTTVNTAENAVEFVSASIISGMFDFRHSGSAGGWTVLHKANEPFFDGTYSMAMGQNWQLSVPFVVPQKCVVDYFWYYYFSGYGVPAVGQVRLGIYEALSPTNLIPCNLVADCGTNALGAYMGPYVQWNGLSVTLNAGTTYYASTIGSVGWYAWPGRSRFCGFNYCIVAQPFGPMPDPHPLGTTLSGWHQNGPFIQYHLSS
jgi:hypothetical protein